MTEWQTTDPREEFWMSRDARITVWAGGLKYAVARVITKGATNPWDIEFLSFDPAELAFLNSENSHWWGANDNWPEGWKWVALP